ncbi:CLUMA_CG008750, isoform A [Clunio marinus]|uniref:CLUMA_CG008750, isoform A n=1 Tax=Clunio marinus TaxID=568069 RepID=A0A1J1I4N1_9DIPT|nr:CLUMA_CG008750, isoform A [Clunio marinus]
MTQFPKVLHLQHSSLLKTHVGISSGVCQLIECHKASKLWYYRKEWVKRFEPIHNCNDEVSFTCNILSYNIRFGLQYSHHSIPGIFMLRFIVFMLD